MDRYHHQDIIVPFDAEMAASGARYLVKEFNYLLPKKLKTYSILNFLYQYFHPFCLRPLSSQDHVLMMSPSFLLEYNSEKTDNQLETQASK